MRYHELRDGRVRITEADPAFLHRCDVLVAGLGSGGAMCALSAAQEGAAVIGLERSGCCGGMFALGAVNGYYYGGRGGYYEKLDRQCERLAGTVYPSFGSAHPDAKKAVLEQALSDAGVEMRFDSVVLGIYAENGRVCGVRAMTGREIREIGCRVLVDATSEGHLLRMYGIRGTFGRSTDGTTQPFTSVRVFRREDGSLSRTNFDSGYVNQYNGKELSNAIIAAHAHHTKALAGPERFLYCAPFIGVREGMLFEGEQRLTLEDILEQRTLEHILFYAYCDLDRHGRDTAFDGPLHQDWFVLSNLSTVAARIPVPVGCVVPKGVKGLLTACRCLSLDSYASSSVRVNRDMQRLGEACGVLAAMCPDGDLTAVDYEALRARLRKRGCFDYMPERSQGFAFPGDENDYTELQWLTEPEDFRRALATETPGVAIWSARRLRKRGVSVDFLADMQEDEGGALRMHAALALGICGDARALPALREIVKNRSAFFLKDCRRSNQLRSVMAICLCGRFADREIAPELLAMLEPEEYERPLYHECMTYSYQFETSPVFNTVYFQHFSHAVAALVRIADAHPDLSEEIRRAFRAHLGGLEYIRRITGDDADTSAYQAALNIRRHALPGAG